MAPTSINQISITAQAVLDAAVTILGTTTAGAPDSQILVSSRPPIDCEFVGVWTPRIAEDSTSPTSVTQTKKRNHFGNIIIVTFMIWVVRCTPNPTTAGPPTDAQKTASAMQIQQDMWALWNGFRALEDDLFDGCLGVYFDQANALEESGGFVGSTFQMRASLEGYTP